MGATAILIIVQNLPVPLDRRVWLECQALRDAGYEVSVICPKGPGDPGYQKLEGVHLYKYAPPPATAGVLSYLVEFAYCWLRTAVLSVRVQLRHGFSVMQACNPPDTYWLLAALWRPFGVRFVFDQHDLNPELYLSRFGPPRGLAARLQYAGLYWLERLTYLWADHVVVTNESYRAIAMQRGGRTSEDITVVRSGPDTDRMRPLAPLPELRQGAAHLLVYLGIMGPQDGIDQLLAIMAELVHVRGRRDVHLAALGFGDMLEPMKRRADELELTQYVTFTGRADRQMIAEYLSTASIGLCPDAKTPLNDVSTHNKVMEYMAYGLPVVTFDLVETQVSAQDCAVYISAGDVGRYAGAIEELLDGVDESLELARRARLRCVEKLDWKPQAVAYVGMFDRLTGARPVDAAESEAADRSWPAVDRRAVPTAQAAPPVIGGRPAIDLRDGRAFEGFLREKMHADENEALVIDLRDGVSVESLMRGHAVAEDSRRPTPLEPAPRSV
jgi:glycosyltransferase involved in cell wall biosynthesis